MSDFKTVYTSSYEVKPEEDLDYCVWASHPHKGQQAWTLVRKDVYDSYQELDLLFDLKDMDQAKNDLKTMTQRLQGLNNHINILTALISRYEGVVKERK